MSKLKMYILVRESVPLGIALTSVAHASLAAYLQYKDHEDVKRWLEGRFYKVICKVNDNEFANAQKAEDHLIINESALDNEPVAIAFRPRENYPKSFKFFRLYKN